MSEARYHEACGTVSFRYSDGECRYCSMARKKDRRRGIVRSHTENTRTWAVPSGYRMTITMEKV